VILSLPSLGKIGLSTRKGVIALKYILKVIARPEKDDPASDSEAREVFGITAQKTLR
jgi:hypothetical protein